MWYLALFSLRGFRCNPPDCHFSLLRVTPFLSYAIFQSSAPILAGQLAVFFGTSVRNVFSHFFIRNRIGIVLPDRTLPLGENNDYRNCPSFSSCASLCRLLVVRFHFTDSSR